MPMCPCNDPTRNRKVPPLSVAPEVLRIAAIWALAAFQGAAAYAQGSGTRIHPAVVRVIVQDKTARSHGSGTLVAVTESFGLVLTNWHVVRDATAPPLVLFPDGFQSAASIARVDRDWDLAALVIWRPRANPIPLAATPPRPGELLAIAGYGKGQYRVATGRCTQYLSPGTRHPFELVELAASARQGDSGGPILNERGELAGVLFGSAFGRTTGSHSGRVRQFLAPLWNDFHRFPAADTMIAAGPHARPPVAAIQEGRPSGPSVGPDISSSGATAPALMPSSGSVAMAAVPGRQAGQHYQPASPLSDGISMSTEVASASERPAGGRAIDSWESSTPEGPPKAASSHDPPSRSEQLKTILAAIGILALVFHGVRLLGQAVQV